MAANRKTSDGFAPFLPWLISPIIGDVDRLTNAFSKKADMLAYSVAITFSYHNFVRVHQTLKTTPAVKAGIAKRKWTIEEMVDLLPLNIAGKRGPYKNRRKLISD